ncbi:MAG: Bax inhibitor-1/YccA family protein [Clostridia bacterium]|nr:Bax inhibitor-1/YccA family protein [Clostridia bacterium]
MALSSTKTRQRNTFLTANPILRRLNNVDESGQTEVCTYKGIAIKTALYMLITFGGGVLYFLLQDSLKTGTPFEITFRGFPVKMYTGQLIGLIACLVLAIFFQLLANFVRSSTPVTGALYCATQGYFIGFLIMVLGPDYQYLGVLALLITLFIIIVMAFLYIKRIIRVTEKFKSVVKILAITMVCISLFITITYLIPVTSSMVSGIVHNYAISIASSIIFIIIASLFLLSDFDTIEHAVEGNLPKKYEWQAAFGLAFAVLWIYIKVLELLMKIVGRSKK